LGAQQPDNVFVSEIGREIFCRTSQGTDNLSLAPNLFDEVLIAPFEPWSGAAELCQLNELGTPDSWV
jgi:hypothetical protein